MAIAVIVYENGAPVPDWAQVAPPSVVRKMPPPVDVPAYARVGVPGSTARARTVPPSGPCVVHVPADAPVAVTRSRAAPSTNNPGTRIIRRSPNLHIDGFLHVGRSQPAAARNGYRI